MKLIIGILCNSKNKNNIMIKSFIKKKLFFTNSNYTKIH